MLSGPTLTTRALNRALLARQHLLARASMSAEAMVEHLVGMQAQVPANPYVALWSRLERFDVGELENLLLERRGPDLAPAHHAAPGHRPRRAQNAARPPARAR